MSLLFQCQCVCVEQVESCMYVADSREACEAFKCILLHHKNLLWMHLIFYTLFWLRSTLTFLLWHVNCVEDVFKIDINRIAVIVAVAATNTGAHFHFQIFLKSIKRA